MNDYKEYLTIAVIQENKPVTYNSLARSLHIHVNTAKQALYEFSQENQRTVHAVYCMTGRTFKNNSFHIQLVKASELEETKKLFKQITGIHVYSVTSFEPLDFSILYSACKDTPKLSIEDRIQCGILKNTNVTMKTPSTSTPVVTKKPEISKPFSKATPTPVNVVPTKSTAKTTTAAASGKRKGTLMFGPVTTKKQAVTTSVEKNKPTPKPNTLFRNTKSSVQNRNDDEEIEMRMAKTTIKPEDIFTDDEGEEEEEEEEEPKPEESEPIILEDEEDDVMEDVEPPKVEATPPPEPTEPTPPGKTKRKVLKKKTTKNARGFLVTEEVWEWETVDESEIPSPSVPSKPKPTPSKPVPKKGAKKGEPAQRNLFSFFQKK